MRNQLQRPFTNNLILNFKFPLARSGWLSIILGLIVALFVFSNAISLSLINEGKIAFPHLIGPTVWLIAYGLVIFFLHQYKSQYDPIILAILMLLSGWSLLMIDRLASNFLSRQITWVSIGTAVIIITTLLPKNLSWLRRYRYTLLLLGLFLLGTTFIFGVNPSGAATANYWLQLPFSIPVFFQPSELLKLLLVIFLASFFDEQLLLQRRNNIVTLLAPIGVMGGFCLLLLVWQRDLGAATLFFLLFLSLFYVATGNRIYLLTGFGLLIIAGILAYYWFDVVALRVDAWANPWPDADGRAFQIVQSLYAFASGGIFGQGIGQGFPDYIPVVHSDFVFAAIGEEWGLIGSLSILFCFILLMHRGLLIALRAKRPFHRYLATGITTLLSAQAILIMGGVTKLLPLTGVTLPFVSYGGSSMLVSHVMIGLLLYLSGHPELETKTAVPINATQRHIQQLHFIFIIIFGLIATSLLYWSIVQAGNILIRDDNPRQVESALRIQRGSIIDRHGVILAKTEGEGNNLTREYPLANIGPAVGYYSFRHGTAGIEEGFDSLLRRPATTDMERYWNETILHRPAVGQNIRLTLDSNLQLAAHALMQNQKGGLILLAYDESNNSADILSMVSAPNHDPNILDEQFDLLIEDQNAPLLNRTTQGLYQPGMILQPFMMATAVYRGNLLLNNSINDASIPIELDSQSVACLDSNLEVKTWEDVLKNRCPYPMSQLGNQVGEAGISQMYADFGLTQPFSIPLNIETAVNLTIDSPELASIGQDSLTVTPMTLGRAWIALMSNGRLPTIQLVSHTQSNSGEWIDNPTNPIPEQEPISPNVAHAIQELLPVFKDDVIEFSGTAVSGEALWNSWYLGSRIIEDEHYFVVIILEENKKADPAEKIGRDLLEFITNQ